METAMESPKTTTHDSGPQAAGSLDALAQMGAAELEALYAKATVPCLDHIEGDLTGRVLALPWMSPRLAPWVQRWAQSRAFPWRGKTLTPDSADGGRGQNRVVFDRLRLFPFGTSIGPSRAGSFDAFQLDYDQPGNPFFIRPIRDEFRQLEDGLWLGQAYWTGGGRTQLLLYFGLAAPTKR